MSQQTGWTRAKIVEHLLVIPYPAASRAADMLEADAAEIERLKSLIRDVIAGNWCITDLQESIGDL